jgi:acyl-CoA thioester hydrolase
MNQKNVEVILNINTYDIDIAGHVNNIVYIKWFENLRTELFDKYFNLNELISNNLYPVVIYTGIKYKKSLQLFDKPLGFMKIENINHGVITLKAEIKLNYKTAASGEQRCVLMNLETGKIDKVKTKSILNDED